jgi:hypothetical protein
LETGAGILRVTMVHGEVRRQVEAFQRRQKNRRPAIVNLAVE